MTSVDERPVRTHETSPGWLRELTAGLGAENVLGPASPAYSDYLDPYAFDDGHAEPAAIVRPGSVPDVQTVLTVARDHGLHIWTVSRGRNFSYGGAEARLPGAIVCDLSRMNRILDVDEQTGAALLEPGVSFWDLDAHLRSTGSKFAVSVPDLSWGSVVGNTLDRGFSYTSQSEHQAAQCGMEVVLADGDVVRTGMGALPGSDTWGLYRGGFGPALDGLFFQSNLGVVTKMGIWLRPRPERAASCTIRVADDAGLGALVEALRPLLIDDTIQSNIVIANPVVITSAITPRAAFYDGPGLMPDSAVEAAMGAFHLGRWNAQFGLVGSAGLLAARVDAVRRAVESVPGAEFSATEYAGDVDPSHVAPPDRTRLGIPSQDALAMAGWRGGRPAHSDIGIVCPPTGEHATAVRRIVQAVVERAGFDYAAGIVLFRRHVVAMAMLTFDGDDRERSVAAKHAIAEVIDECGAAGYGAYRSHLAHMDRAMGQYSFNDHALLRTLGRLKDALDPVGILSPGKQGVWPGSGRRDESRDAVPSR